MIETTHLKNVIEAALLAAGKPLQITELAQLFEEHARPDNATVKTALDALAADYEGRGIEVKETATGFRIQVRKELAPEVSRLWPERPPKYSRALLETLALIAYRQPITRAEIEAVRGVAVNPNIVKTLLERGWVRVVGTRDVPGRPELLGTTRDFLDYFGLKALDELPPLAEIKAMTDPNLQLALTTATPAAAAPVDGLTNDAAGVAGGDAAAVAANDNTAAAANGEADALSASAANGESVATAGSAGSESAAAINDAVAATDGEIVSNGEAVASTDSTVDGEVAANGDAASANAAGVAGESAAAEIPATRRRAAGARKRAGAADTTVEGNANASVIAQASAGAEAAAVGVEGAIAASAEASDGTADASNEAVAEDIADNFVADSVLAEVSEEAEVAIDDEADEQTLESHSTEDDEDAETRKAHASDDLGFDDELTDDDEEDTEGDSAELVAARRNYED